MTFMNPKIYPITDLRRRTSEIIEGIKANSDTVYITQHGRPEIVLLNYERYEEMIAQLEQGAAIRKQQSAINLLQSWIDTDDPTEQQETGEALLEGLDENRLSDRSLFPSELKGHTW